MRVKVVVHQKDDGTFWAEIPAIPGCAAEGRTFDELLTTLPEVINAKLNADLDDIDTQNGKVRIIEVMV